MIYEEGIQVNRTREKTNSISTANDFFFGREKKDY